jgi:hypothetical protein
MGALLAFAHLMAPPQRKRGGYEKIKKNFKVKILTKKKHLFCVLKFRTT